MLVSINGPPPWTGKKKHQRVNYETHAGFGYGQKLMIPSPQQQLLRLRRFHGLLRGSLTEPEADNRTVDADERGKECGKSIVGGPR